jgi:DNA-binding NarL/FixJ family response regulator
VFTNVLGAIAQRVDESPVTSTPSVLPFGLFSTRERMKVPVVIIMDITMPKMNGIKATAAITSLHPEIKVIGLSVQTGKAHEKKPVPSCC